MDEFQFWVKVHGLKTYLTQKLTTLKTTEIYVEIQLNMHTTLYSKKNAENKKMCYGMAYE